MPLKVGKKVNVKLLRKIKKHILEEPRRFAMGHLVLHGAPDSLSGIRADDYNAYNAYESEQTFPACGTIACIMGWAERLAKPGEDINDAKRMCSAEAWPDEFSRRYHEAVTPLERAKIAAERIEHYIKTKGAE